MAAAKDEPIDDTVWNHPGMLQWWVNEQGGQHMDENLIHRYFSESPFFDWTSKNGFMIDHSKRDMFSFNRANNRKEFESQLRSRAGVEYMIVDTPKPVQDKELAAQGAMSGIYVIRKQDRQRPPEDSYLRPPHVLVEKGPDGKDAWHLTVLGTYYIVGENVLQAPSVFDVVSNRLLAASASLNRFYEIAGILPKYTPAAGFHYLPRPTKATTSLSVPGTPNRSREGSLAPDTEEQSLRSGSVQPESHAGGAASMANHKDMKLLSQSLIDAGQFGDDYIDENPLLGEPGNFRFSASTAAIKKRRADEEAAVAKAKAEESANTSRVASPKAEKAPTPPAVFTEKAAGKEKVGKDGERRGSKKSNKERRKSRVNAGGSATTPTTPGSATSPQAPNSAL